MRFQELLYTTSSISSFVPTSLGSKLKLFLNANDSGSITKNSDDETEQINDLSGNSNHYSESTQTKRPRHVNNFLRFDGTDDQLSLSSASFASDQQGELIIMIAQIEFNRPVYAFALANNASNDDYLTFNKGDDADSNAFFYQENDTPTTKLIENNTYQKWENLGWNIYSIQSDGSTIRIYDKDGELTLTVSAGSNSGLWFGDKTGIFSLLSLLRSTELYSKAVFGGLVYCDQVLTSQERTDTIDWFKREFLGSSNPPNFSFQFFNPVHTLDNALYNFDGSIAKNPVNGKIVSFWSRGTSHYLNGDLHDIAFQISEDNMESFGTDQTAVAGGSNLSYTNVSCGYSSSGRLHIIYTRVDHTGGSNTNLAISWRYSDNDGTTWSEESDIAGITLFGVLNSNSTIIEDTSGNLYCTFYEAVVGGTVNLQLIRSTDNGVTWSIYSAIDTSTWSAAGNPVNETCIRYIGTNTILAVTRVNGKAFYLQYISTDNGLNWTKQGQTSFSDFWQDGTVGATSTRMHLVRFDTFTMQSTLCVGLMYMNRGVAVEGGNDTYFRVAFAKGQDLVDHGVEGWADIAGLKMKVTGFSLNRYDGYQDIRFFDNDSLAYVRSFKSVTIDQNADTRVQYSKYRFDTDYLRAILKL